MQKTHQVTPDDTFDWLHAQNLLNFGDCVKRKSTGLVLDPKENWHVSDDDKQATDWQLVEPEHKYVY